MNEPLNQFAERLIRNCEVALFVRGLIEKGVSASEIIQAAKQEETDPQPYERGGGHRD